MAEDLVLFVRSAISQITQHLSVRTDLTKILVQATMVVMDTLNSLEVMDMVRLVIVSFKDTSLVRIKDKVLELPLWQHKK